MGSTWPPRTRCPRRNVKSDDEDGAMTQLGRVPILARVELGDRRVEVDGEVRDVQLLERAGRDDDPRCLETLLAPTRTPRPPRPQPPPPPPLSPAASA